MDCHLADGSRHGGAGPTVGPVEGCCDSAAPRPYVAALARFSSLKVTREWSNSSTIGLPSSLSAAIADG